MSTPPGAEGRKYVLVSWVARDNDPFRTKDGPEVPGPTLTILFDEKSPYRGRVSHAVLFRNVPKHARDQSEIDRASRPWQQTRDEIFKRKTSIQLEDTSPWITDDPTDHAAIYDFITQQLAAIRQRFADRTLLIHISPGTPAMQTVWALLHATGAISGDYEIVKSVPLQYGGPVETVRFELDTYLRHYRKSRPALVEALDTPRFEPDRASAKLRAVFDDAARYAPLRVPVLILGERGTGKTTLANWIRSNSPFRQEKNDGSWPAAACGQFTPELMRSELFGHRKGSFTGATHDKVGLIARAHRETLFLDEIGDIDEEVQRLLIVAVEEGRYSPVGSDQTEESHFRLICATNRSWRSLCEDVTPDFLDRISMLTLELPPLRELRGDLWWYWRDVWKNARERADVLTPDPLQEAHHARIVEILEARRLPGNFRDLQRIAYELLAQLPAHRAERAIEHARSRTERWESAPEYIPRSRRNAPATPVADVRNAVDMDDDIPRSVARAFGQRQPLDGLLDRVGMLEPRMVTIELERFMADELNRIAHARGKPLKALTDVSERTLRSWRKRDRK